MEGMTMRVMPSKLRLAIPCALLALLGGFQGSASRAAARPLTAAAEPVFSPKAGTYSAAQRVSISDTTSGATIYYTTNGATPTTASTKYEAPIAVASTETIKAIAVASGYTQSPVNTAAYTISVAAAAIAWMPYTATPAGGATPGKTGLFVLPTTGLAASSTATFVTTEPVSVLAIPGVAAAGAYKGYRDASYTPQGLIYASTGSDGKVHIYAISLTNAAKVPTPVQLSDLALQTTNSICASQIIQSNLNDFTTAAVLIELAGSNGCFATGDTYALVHFTDSPTVAPTSVSLPPYSNFNPVYEYSGTLGGLLQLARPSGSGSTSHLYFYANETFKNPVTLLSGITFGEVFPVVTDSASSGPNYGILVTGTNAGGTSFLYGITPGGVLTQLFQTTASLTGGLACDDDNVYFMSTAGTTTKVYQLPRSLGGSPLLLYGGTGLQSTTLLASNDVDLVLLETGGGSVYSIPVGKTSTAPKALAVPSSTLDYLGVSMVGTSATSSAGKVLFVSHQAPEVINEGFGYTSSTTVLSPAGAVLQALTKQASYDDSGNGWGDIPPASGLLAGVMLQVSGYTETDGGFGGGQINVVNVATRATAPLKTPAGAIYQVPEGYLVPFYAYTASAAAGVLQPSYFAASDSTPLALVADLSHDVVVEVGFPGTNVALFGGL
jgi:hypothetical protein